MKKKLVAGATVFALIFLAGGLYVVFTIDKSTTQLNNLIRLHQVALLRDRLSVQLRSVQSDLNLRNTRYARGVDTVVTHVRNMQTTLDACFTCHHVEETLDVLNRLQAESERYQGALSRVLTVRANVRRLEMEEDRAFRLGETVIADMDEIISYTGARLEQRTQAALRKIERTRSVLFGLVATSLVLSGGLAFGLVRGLARPVTVLLEATRNLRRGDLDHRIEGLKDEFGEVAASFNQMAASLKEQMEKIHRTEQMIVIGDLSARLAHEIKNPLAGIKQSIEILGQDPIVSEEHRAVLKMVTGEIRRIELLMNSLLDFARPKKPELVKVDVEEVLEHTLTFLGSSTAAMPAGSGKIDFVREFEGGLPEVSADPMQLQQVFLNLFLNAVAAMPDGGTLRVRTTHAVSDGAIGIDICDTGTGMEAGVIDRIFEPFFTTKSQGTGLGLAVARQVVEKHGGNIVARNNADRGATFRITLPAVDQVADGPARMGAADIGAVASGPIPPGRR